MTDNLKSATLFAALLTNDYEQSEACAFCALNVLPLKNDSQGGRRIADRIVFVLDCKVQLD